MMFFNNSVLKLNSPKRFIKKEQFIADQRESHTITVSGTYYDMGLLLGLNYGKLIRDEVDSGYRSIKRKVSLFLNKIETLEEELEQAVDAFAPYVPWECKAELLGLYDGCAEAGYPFPEGVLEKFLVLVELGEQECTLFAAQPPMTTGDTFQLRDLDYYKNIGMSYIPSLIVRIPQNEQGKLIDAAYASFDFIASFTGGALTGVNEHGVAFSQSRGPFFKRFSVHGVPIKCLIQQILTKTQTALQAVELIKNNKPSTAHFAIISDPKQTKESLQLIFMGPELLHHYEHNTEPDLSLINYDDPELRFYKPIEGIVYWTDMVDRKVNGVTEEFLMSDMCGLLERNQNDLSEATCLKIAKTVGNDITFLTAVFNTTTLEAWVAYASRKKPAHTNEFVYFDLKKYFSYKNGLD